MTYYMRPLFIEIIFTSLKSTQSCTGKMITYYFKLGHQDYFHISYIYAELISKMMTNCIKLIFTILTLQIASWVNLTTVLLNIRILWS